VVFALVGVVAVAALFMFTRRSPESGGSSSPAPAASPAPAQDSAAARSPGAATGSPSATGSQSSAGSQSATGSDSSSAKAPQGQAAGAQSSAEKRGLPIRVQSALDAHKAVVLLFWNAKGVDDRSVKKSVDHLSHRNGRVAIFTDGIGNVARYSRISASLEITQSPSLVFVNRKGEAEVQTGYLDYETINQYVTNALKR
jgi:hypothetical protein